MSLENVNEEYRIEEQSVQKSIYDAINNNKKIVFNAGAGAGKTYALIESLKYIIKQYGAKLISTNQKIICITYTNTAVHEIRERLGNTDIVLVSTIHERLWDLIKSYKKELLIIHIENLRSKLSELNNTLNEDEEQTEFSAYRLLDENSKESLKDYLLNNKDTYYKNFGKSAQIFRASFSNALDSYPNIIRNVSHFKKIAGTIFKIANYQNCLQNISDNHEEYRKVEYDAKYNTDILHKMVISHDTLIQYALEIFNSYDLLKRLTIDQYPYLLIDEYQDTNSSVVKIISLLHQYSEKKKLPLFIGYFGDPIQNIYNDGIGTELSDIHSGLISIDKIFNRRSNIEIIEIINKIRGGSILQKSIYSDCTGGSVKFYTARNRDEGLVKSFINKYKVKWNSSSSEPLHCLVLTNKTVAEYSGFPEVFNLINSTNYYKDKYQQAGTEILSHELNKLGKVPMMFYNILNFKDIVDNPRTTIADILNEFEYRELSFAELKNIISCFHKLSGSTIGEYIDSIFKTYNESQCPVLFKSIVERLVKLHEYSFESFNRLLFETLFQNIDTENSDDINAAETQIQSIMQISIDEFTRWYDFINETQNTDVVYHTYHGTKGREYDNVIIIMENNFGRMNPNKFSNFFRILSNPSQLTDPEAIPQFKNTRNLIYVACSRARRNLRILYLDDSTTFNDGIQQIFGDVIEYS